MTRSHRRTGRKRARQNASKQAAATGITDGQRVRHREARSGRFGWLALLGMVGLPALLAAAVFANTLPNQFVYDDKWTLDRLPAYSYITSLSFLRSGRGLTYAVHLLDRWLWDSWAPGFRLTNIVLHSLASSLATYTAFVLIRSARAALLCGLLFAVHPVHVEAVALFSYRKDILAMIFVSLALIWWLGTRRQVLCYLASLLCLGLGLLSKEVAAVGLVPVLFLADLLPGHQHPARWTHRLRRGICRIIPIVIVGIVATTAFAGDILNYFTPQSIQDVTKEQLRTYGQVLAASAGAVPHVVRLLFVPATLSADYPTRAQTSPEDPSAMIGVVLIGFWIMGALFLARRSPVAAFGMAWTLITYLPCSNIIPLTGFFVAERYLYVPSFGVCLLLALALQQGAVTASARGRAWLRRGIVGLSILLVTAGAARSVLRCRDWQDDRRIWSSAIRDGFGTARAHFNLGNALRREGNLDEAVRAYRNALRRNPGHMKAHLGLAVALEQQQKYHEAIQAYRMGWALANANGETRLADEIEASINRVEHALGPSAPSTVN